MKKLLLLIAWPVQLFCQNTIGLPEVINYSKQSYTAGLQNWDIKQDKNGIIYVANNEGLLSFNGKSWNLYALPNKTIVRSVEIGADNKIYVGGQDELGYFSPGKNGQLQYHSLTQLISLKDRSFGDIWDIAYFNKNIFFRSTNTIFKFTNEAVATYKSQSEWSYMGLCNGKLYAHDYLTGLMNFENDIFAPLHLTNELPVNDPVTGLIPAPDDKALVTTLKHGLYTLSKTSISRLSTTNTPLFENERIYAATSISNERIALATNNSGIYIIDFKGNIVQSFAKMEGLQNNNVLSIFLDRQSNLWLGLDNGIDFIAYNSAIKKINPVLQSGSGYTSIIFNNRLFVGTTNGLYSVALQATKDLSFCKGDFQLVNNTKGQTWKLAEINNQLLLGNHEGAFEIRNNIAYPFSSNPGFWNFVPLSGTFPTTKMVAGNYKGLVFFDFIGGKFIQSAGIPGFDESSRFVAIDRDDNIWVSHPYHGVFRISKNNAGVYTTHPYTEKKGLPSLLNNHIYKVRSEVVAATEKGVYAYNQQKDRFEPSPFYGKLLGRQSIRYLKEDLSGNIWFVHEKSLGVMDLSDKEAALVYLPEVNNEFLSGFEFIYPVNESNILLGGEKGVFHINYEKYKKSIPALQVQISIVRIINQTDSLLFGGYFSAVNEKQLQDSKNIPELKHIWKTIHFEFSSPLFGYQPNLEFSFRLKGYEEAFSDWNKRTEKEYTNLSTGNYTFEVKVKNNLGKESAISSYTFSILPPWYKSLWARGIYFLLLGLSLFALHKWQRRRFKRQEARHEEEQKRLSYIHELELNKTESELMALSNEKLEAEIDFKNAELASSAMHLVKKGELFSKIKTELTHVLKGFDNPQAAAELKKMIKTIGEDDNMDEEWGNFTKHFDKVHSDFLVVLKEIHPTITPNELKLCAYLRMNLSTKEIAQLMNISGRGVEISRYRLRKKLQIPSEKSLFDHLIHLQTKT
jgi:ligand-binding sensor domain-containing protein/DNA-binding CsgD family transcriptional regulator